MFASAASRPRPADLRRGLVLLLLGLGAALAAAAQDVNVAHPIDYIEHRLHATPIEVLQMEQARPSIEGDRSVRVVLGGPDDAEPMEAKWKPVRPRATGFNNEPRYELAAYAFQKLFLDEDEYVVPPIVLRSLALESYRAMHGEAEAALRGTSSALFLLAYWVQNVTNRDPYDADAFETDTEYARRWGHLNLLTHLISHRDGNLGNILISSAPESRRLFSVDNDVAFNSEISHQGDRWSELLVNRLPARAIERLRSVTAADLERSLAVLAEFSIVDGRLEPVVPGPNLNARRGLRMADDRVQFGLNSSELAGLERRITRLLRDVDRGRIEIF